MKLHDGVLAFWMSIIPLTSPIIMMARLPFGVESWELILSRQHEHVFIELASPYFSHHYYWRG